jgi:hypothetical protein
MCTSGTGRAGTSSAPEQVCRCTGSVVPPAWIGLTAPSSKTGPAVSLDVSGDYWPSGPEGPKGPVVRKKRASIVRHQRDARCWWAE